MEKQIKRFTKIFKNNILYNDVKWDKCPNIHEVDKRLMGRSGKLSEAINCHGIRWNAALKKDSENVPWSLTVALTFRLVKP